MRKNILYIMSAVLCAGLLTGGARADTTTAASPAASNVSIDDLQQQIQTQQNAIKQLEDKITNYQNTISVKQKEASSLNNQVDILDAQISKAELDLELVADHISQLELEIRVLSTSIDTKNQTIGREQGLLAGLVRTVHTEDSKNYVYVLLAEPSFSQFFNQIFYLNELNNQLDQSVRAIQKERDDVQEQHDISARKQTLLQDLQASLEDKRAALDEQKKAKAILLSETRSSEIKFKTLLTQARAEYNQMDQEVLDLNKKLRDKLLANNDINENGVLVLSWPLADSRKISTYFHDPTYPFRYLFEHPGIDVPTHVGTPVVAAAPGYVAWVRTTRLYGNNVMLAHRDNINTIYAHLSRFNVKEGDYVKRGDVLAWSGGAPGMQGAGLSTGAHLHFEVRENGLPVDPLGYLMK